MKKLSTVLAIVALVTVAGWVTGCGKKEKAAAPAPAAATEAAPAAAPEAAPAAAPEAAK